ncbi:MULTISPECIES: sigma-54 interaction domain-containing protein [Niastella]|uniref:Sigma 54-interacting transcriptional regulator n=1 Tax=Niastella soli TaxID=2821487 RepID=A0ABS3YRS6_9BACT|nr:sigma 54-interacting transcriptional regulator [Niastella soli]MBO9200488.1 sigma 54-interacting transcriptional regulator [Niastella soli]
MRFQEEQLTHKEGNENRLPAQEIIGQSPELKEILRLISIVAPSDSTVLLLGETGTGKELVARAIHEGSSRGKKTMIQLNCAALPANLVESELFGHERGSFTGAMERRIGKFELAHQGTLFLDEIGEMPLELQVKLLRALQEKEIERIGSRTTMKVNVRIVAATNRDLEKEVEEGRFRADLFYRLNIFPIRLPALRDRREDIPLLANFFVQKLSKKIGRNISAISDSALEEMFNYDWPGNIRELEHVIERSILLAEDDVLRQVYLCTRRQSSVKRISDNDFQPKTIEENEREHILRILKYCKGKVAGFDGAAKVLGVPPSTLNSKLKRFGIRKIHYEIKDPNVFDNTNS